MLREKFELLINIVLLISGKPMLVTVTGLAQVNLVAILETIYLLLPMTIMYFIMVCTLFDLFMIITDKLL